MEDRGASQLNWAKARATPNQTYTLATPPLGMIKLNVNVAVNDSCARICILVSDSLVAETSGILWVLQLALLENYRAIVMEGDYVRLIIAYLDFC